MRNYIKKMLLGTLSMFLLLPFVPVNADSYGEIEVINNVEAGLVSISLTQHDENNQEITDKTKPQIVVPNQVIHRVATITNQAEPCWIRAKVSYTFNDKAVVYPDNMITTASDKWVKKGEWWYYKEAVAHNESVDFIKEEKMPEEWVEKDSGSEFRLLVHADAVQKVNFTPDFNRDDPWFGTVIETSLYDKAEHKTGTDTKFAVTFLGGSEGLIKKGADFFSNWGTLMPGDTVSDTLAIGNTYSEPVSLYFRIDDIDTGKFAKACELKVWAGEKLLYNGTLAGAMQEINLAYMDPGYSAVLRYELHVPEELRNEYALEDAKMKWVFRAEIHHRVNTGESGTNLVVPIAVGTAAFVLLIAVAFVMSRKKKEGARNE